MRLVLIALLLLPVTAMADPVTIVAITGWTMTTATIVSIGLYVGMAVYGTAQQRKAKRKARDAHNAGLQDRMATRIATEAPFVYVYGRARIGASIVAMFTSGDKDQYKHLVCVHAAHECDAIEEIWVANQPLGALDANGYSSNSSFTSSERKLATHRMPETGTFVLPNDNVVPGSVSVMWVAKDDRNYAEFSYDPATRTVTYPAGPYSGSLYYRVTYLYDAYTYRVRVQKHLGTPSDPADAYLMSVVPSKWTANHVLRGFCYTVITLDLNQPEFQGGIPEISVLLRGKKLYDPRTGLTQWSQNNALVIRDYLTGPVCNIDAADLPEEDFVTAANVCDEAQSFGKRYTFNGAVFADEDKAQVLERMAQSMAGGIVSTTWSIYAGKYVAPVMALTQEDIIGSLAINPGMSDADLYNTVHGQYISSENGYVATDIKPYIQSAYLEADGRELVTNIDFPYTDGVQRAHNLCRVFVEDQRNGYTVKGQFSRKVWALKVGQRVTLTSPFFGWNAKVFRVTDKSYAPGGTVELTLKEDAASIWDFADAVTVDSTPNSDLPNPFFIPAPASVTCASGNDQLLRLQDGSIVSRILVTWPEATMPGVFNNGKVEIEAQKDDSTVWQKSEAKGDETSGYVSPVEDGAFYAVRVRYVDPYFNVKSDWAYADLHQVVGKTEPPPNVEAFSITNGVLSWPEITGVPDLAGYEIRFHYGRKTSWEDAARLSDGILASSPWKPELIPPGAITLMIKAVDTSGNVSLNAASMLVNFGDPIVENLILSYDDKAAGFPGTKTNCAVIGGDLLADDSGDLFWSDDGAKFWGFDSADFWPTATYKEATYLTSYTVQPDEVGSRLTLLTAITAEAYRLEYRYETQGQHWGNDANFYWRDDAALFWPPATGWRTWPGAIDGIEEGQIQFRIITQAGIVRGKVSELTLQFDVEDETEELDDIAISASGTRLPITKTYRAIKNIQLTLQDDGGSAASVKWADKDPTGPLIYCFNSSGAKVAGVIDARIQGVKG